MLGFWRLLCHLFSWGGWDDKWMLSSPTSFFAAWKLNILLTVCAMTKKEKSKNLSAWIIQTIHAINDVRWPTASSDVFILLFLSVSLICLISTVSVVSFLCVGFPCSTSVCTFLALAAFKSGQRWDRRLSHHTWAFLFHTKILRLHLDSVFFPNPARETGPAHQRACHRHLGLQRSAGVEATQRRRQLWDYRLHHPEVWHKDRGVCDGGGVWGVCVWAGVILQLGGKLKTRRPQSATSSFLVREGI